MNGNTILPEEFSGLAQVIAIGMVHKIDLGAVVQGNFPTVLFLITTFLFADAYFANGVEGDIYQCGVHGAYPEPCIGPFELELLRAHNNFAHQEGRTVQSGQKQAQASQGEQGPVG